MDSVGMKVARSTDAPPQEVGPVQARPLVIEVVERLQLDVTPYKLRAFDGDGTLYHTETGHKSSYANACAAFLGCSLTPEQIDLVDAVAGTGDYGHSMEVARALLRFAREPVENWAASVHPTIIRGGASGSEHLHFYDTALQALVASEVLLHRTTHFLNNMEAVEPVEGARELLSFQNGSTPVLLVTGTIANICKPLCHQHSFFQYFDHIVSPENFGERAKPDRLPYQIARRLAEVQPGEPALALEDTASGVIAAVLDGYDVILRIADETISEVDKVTAKIRAATAPHLEELQRVGKVWIVPGRGWENVSFMAEVS